MRPSSSAGRASASPSAAQRPHGQVVQARGHSALYAACAPAHEGAEDLARFRHLTDEEKHRALLFANRQLRHRSLNSTLVYTQPNKEEMQVVGAI